MVPRNTLPPQNLESWQPQRAMAFVALLPTLLSFHVQPRLTHTARAITPHAVALPRPSFSAGRFRGGASEAFRASPVKMVDPPAELVNLTFALISGTGRMGVHIGAAWANAGLDVMLCSRSKEKADKIVAELLSGKGYSDGQVDVAPCSTEGWKLRGGSEADAAKADVIALTTAPYEASIPQLEKLAPLVRGKGKIFLDITNPFVMGQGIPADQPQSSTLVHRQLLNDETAKWVHAYRNMYFRYCQPTGPPPQAGGKHGIEVLGDKEAVDVISAAIRSHGFDPVFRGGLDKAEAHELKFGPNGLQYVSDPTGLVFREVEARDALNYPPFEDGKTKES